MCFAGADLAHTAKEAAEDHLHESTAAADADVARIRVKHAAELLAAITQRDLRVAAADAAIEVAATAVGEVVEARNHLVATAIPVLLGNVADLRGRRDDESVRIEQFQSAIRESDRIRNINPVLPDRNEHTHPFGGSSHDASLSRCDEQKARDAARLIQDRETKSIKACVARIADIEQRIADIDEAIHAAEAELLLP